MVEKMQHQMTDNGYTWDANFHRLRCLGHIINLAAQDFFFKKVPDPENKAGWRSFGSYGKLHNIVLWVRKSPQRMERFKELSCLQLIRDNSTCWHSYYDMCERALFLRDEITELLNTESELEKDYLSHTDWTHLGNISSFLKPFRQATKVNEGIFDAIDRVLPWIEFLMEHLENSRLTWANYYYMHERVERAWEKLDKYYQITDSSIAYISATVLNPMYKWQWFDARWTTPNLIPALIQGKVELRRLWESDYAGTFTARPITPQNIENSAEDDLTAFFIRTAAATAEHTRTQAIDELETYLREPLLDVPRHLVTSFRGLTWWLEDTQQRRYPRLSKMAVDLLTVPAMSAEIERVFSECSLALNSQRLSMSQSTLEQLMCLRSWRRQEQRVSHVDLGVAPLKSYRTRLLPYAYSTMIILCSTTHLLCVDSVTRRKEKETSSW